MSQSRESNLLLNQTNQNSYLRLVNVTKTYQEGGVQRSILSDASAEFRKGEFVSLLGKSGSGKTTLLNIISGIDGLDAGNIFLGEIRLTGLSENERTLLRRRRIGFIFQFFNLIPTLNVWDNITLPLELNGMMDKGGKERALSLLGEVGLSNRLTAFPEQLSGGEKQRLAISRALVHDPDLVLADEPTGNLDEETGQIILTLINRLTRKSGKNLILVTHSPDAAAIGDRIFHLRNGKLVEDGFQV
jgi:putative ABC transport system ATP-binding protein